MKLYKLVAALVVVASILMQSACVSLHTGAVAQSFKYKAAAKRQINLAAIANFSLSGAISIQTPAKNYVANYSWQQAGRRYTIRLASALNAVTYVLSGRPGMVSLSRARQHPITSTSVRELLQQQLGYFIPITGLRYWILGLPAPGRSQKTYDTYGHLKSLQQQGWQINYLLYQSSARVDLPRLIELTGHKLKIRCVIKNWQLDS